MFENNSYEQSIVNAFPEIAASIDEFQNFDWHAKGLWGDWENSRIFLDEFARRSKLDPLDPMFWYHLLREDIVLEGGEPALSRHNDSHRFMIVATFPEIGVDVSEFCGWKRVYAYSELEDYFVSSFRQLMYLK